MATLARSTSEWESTLGSRIKAARRDRGLTQAVLADRANVSRSAIKSLESGRGSSLSTFINVVRALDLDTVLDQVFAVSATVSPLALLDAQREASR